MAARQASRQLGSPSDLGAPSRSTGLSTGLLDRLFSPEVARERLREAIWDDLGLILGRPNLENHRFSLGKKMVFRKSTFSLSEATWRRLGDHLGRLGAPLGPLGHLSWHSEAPLGSLGPLPGRLGSALGRLPGAPETQLGPSSGSRPLPGSILQGNSPKIKKKNACRTFCDLCLLRRVARLELSNQASKMKFGYDM